MEREYHNIKGLILKIYKGPNNGRTFDNLMPKYIINFSFLPFGQQGLKGQYSSMNRFP
jgi:hypothetical protein